MAKRRERQAAKHAEASVTAHRSTDQGRPADDLLWWAPWLTAVVAILLYVNSMPGDFVLDDCRVIKDQPRLMQPRRWDEIWTSHYWAMEGEKPWTKQDLLYRPLTLQTYAFNYLISASPWHFHLVNVALYGALCLGIWRLARRIFDSPLAATAGGLLFAVHPLHTEVVANLVGRSELLAGGFITAALLCWYRDQRRPHMGWAALGWASAAGAMLSKESGVMLLPTAILMDWWWSRKRDAPGRGRPFWIGRAKRCYVVLIVTAAAYLTARYYACGQRVRTDHEGVMINVLLEADTVGRIFGPFKVLGKYLSLFVLPVSLCADYGFNSFPPPGSPLEPLTSLGILAVVAGAVGAILSWRRSREWLLMAGIFAFPYFLVSNSVILIGTILGERLFFWPSMPLCLYAGRLAERLWQGKGVKSIFPQRPAACLEKSQADPFSAGKAGPLPGEQAGLSRARRIMFWGGVTLLIALAGRSIWRNFDWAANYTLMLASMAVHPRSAKVQMGVAGRLVRQANDHFDRGEYAEHVNAMGQANKHFHKALEIYPDYSVCWLGVAITRGRFLVDRAYEAAEYRIGSRKKGADVTIGEILEAGRDAIKKMPVLELDHIKESARDMEAYRQMYTTPDSQAESIYHVLRSVLDHGQFLEYRLAEAQDALRRASSGPPLEPHARDLIGLLPGISDVGLIRQYGLLCMEAGGFDEAAAYLMKAHKLLPDDENVAIALARALAPLGVEQMTQASEVLVEVLQKNYQSWRAHLELGLMIGGINPTSAVEHGRIAANLAPKEPADQYLRAQIGYARILETAKRCAQAIEQYQYVLSIAPDVPLRTRLIEWRISELKQKMRRG